MKSETRQVCADYKSQRGLKASVVALFELVDRKRIAAVALLFIVLSFPLLRQLLVVVL